ncbi:hypothetical protein, partial [Pseudomonas viridiflava]|uniref:hypothetical protein n=1 Tax=Pseudomonas viridiflava TaxID=33069 RepID=UPI0019D101AD
SKGFTYWRRSHQIPGVVCCWEHFTHLHYRANLCPWACTRFCPFIVKRYSFLGRCDNSLLAGFLGMANNREHINLVSSITSNTVPGSQASNVTASQNKALAKSQGSTEYAAVDSQKDTSSLSSLSLQLS